MKLSILIPTTEDRKEYLDRLLDVLKPQAFLYSDRIEVCINSSGKHMTTGTKRNNLIEEAIGDYIVFLDDDDMITPDYVQKILDATMTNPDVITFRGFMITDNRFETVVEFILHHGEKYEARDGKYYRFPNHIVPMRKELVKDFKFPDVWLGEDYTWAKAIHDAGVLKTHVHIDQMLYFYLFRSNK
jgi:glycosyltransferase involved in cell wall biosynthesis